jgi:uncharacterized Zn-binding protein involved in type VI secretion
MRMLIRQTSPPNPVPVPFPITGPVIPIPFFSGASRVLINGMPAARCGDIGIGVWCGGYFPMYEIFLGSSNVWIEGARAARVGVDITKHCIFSTPKPTDLPIGPPIGTTVTSSPNVLIGGVPMPSLTSLAIGGAFKVVFAGLSRIARATATKLGSFSRSRLAEAWRRIDWKDDRGSINAFGRAGDELPLGATGRLKPAAPVPNASPPNPRHYPRRVKQNTYAQEYNTMILPSTDIRPDLAAIQSGRAMRDGDYYVVSDRYYGIHQNGNTYPVQGPGFVRLDRGSFKALGLYNKLGETPRAEEILDNMGISAEQRQAAQNVRRQL